MSSKSTSADRSERRAGRGIRRQWRREREEKQMQQTRQRQRHHTSERTNKTHHTESHTWTRAQNSERTDDESRLKSVTQTVKSRGQHMLLPSGASIVGYPNPLAQAPTVGPTWVHKAYKPSTDQRSTKRTQLNADTRRIQPAGRNEHRSNWTLAG